MAGYPMPPLQVQAALRAGLVIPAHPLALTAGRSFDERRQRGLGRYYHAAGVGGVAVGVHSTQFAIREPRFGLFKPVMQLAATTLRACDHAANRLTVLVAGICGQTEQAVAEARFACETGYHVGLLSLSAFPGADDETLMAHCRTVAHEMPLMGFYLQPAAGGRLLSETFWRRFAEIPNVVAIKMAPFNRYQTLDVIRAVAAAGRADDIALYTGNDDNILVDLLTEFAVPTPQGEVRLHVAGGLLGQFGVWTHTACALLERVKQARQAAAIPAELLTLAAQLTDCNSAIFDAAHHFAGALPGIHEILRRQGLLDNHFTLDPAEALSPGQAAEIERVCAAYTHLSDDEFVQANLADWLD